MGPSETASASKGVRIKNSQAFWLILLVVLIAAGTLLRFTGLDWDDGHHLHPDERFLTMVTGNLSKTPSLSAYFDTAQSTLNPSNTGHGFYVYGTFPVIVTYLIADQLEMGGYDQVYLVGRVISAVVDILTILLVYVIAQMMFRKPPLSVLAAGFTAFSVLQIQQAHYYTVDSFANAFLTLSLLMLILLHERLTERLRKDDNYSGRDLVLYALAGMVFGMAAASKVSYAPVAFILPLVMFLTYWQSGRTSDPKQLRGGLISLAVAALVTLLTFRVLQPYAFRGPGFFNMLLSEEWLNSLRQLSAMSAGDVDFPPALQWARRPITFSLKNMVLYGMGLAWGVTAWASFILMGWRMWRDRWFTPLPVWAWTAFNFIMQSVNFTRSMRYQLPIYTSLAIIAAWGLCALASWAWRRQLVWQRQVIRPAVVLLFVGVMGYTILYAVAFTSIYTRPVTRVAASEWIYQNVPTSLSLIVDKEGDFVRQPIIYPNAFSLSQQTPWRISFVAGVDATPTALRFPYLLDQSNSEFEKTVEVLLCDDPECQKVLTSGTLSAPFTQRDDPRGSSYVFPFMEAPQLNAGRTYYVIARLSDPLSIIRMYTAPQLNMIGTDGEMVWYLPEPTHAVSQAESFQATFIARETGRLQEAQMAHVIDWVGLGHESRLIITVYDATSGEKLDSAEITSPFLDDAASRGAAFSARFVSGALIESQRAYRIEVSVANPDALIALYGSKQALESSWDDPIPMSMYGISALDYNIGQYRGDDNFELYWDDDTSKLERIKRLLHNNDYLFITSSRIWGSVVQIPERYPLTNAYYRHLMGCPDELGLFDCFAEAQPGMHAGRLGYDLVQVFQSEPCIGTFCINTQYAEEAFNVYDHPKVFIFKKVEHYDAAQTAALLDAVDLSQVRRLTPREASEGGGAIEKTLMLPDDLLQIQRDGGTWSQLFDRLSQVNQHPWLAALVWYLALMLIGFLLLPLLLLIFDNLPDGGYAGAKLIGLMAVSWLSWWGGSAGIVVTLQQIIVAILILLAMSLIAAVLQGNKIKSRLHSRWRLILSLELVSLLAFTAFLLVRTGNPDLWHPYKGGEKPMDFAYFNAIIKSSVYPPYDPWFAGGYINYYYYGFVIYGTLAKLLGIMPSIAYNLLLASVFSFAATLIFSLVSHLGRQIDTGQTSRRFGWGLAMLGVLLVLVVGNFGAVRMIWQGFQRLAPEYQPNSSPLQQGLFAIQGLIASFSGSSLPYSPGEWYWNPSRAIPGDVITEFPAFTFLYADPHAHLMALPVTILVIYWVVALLGKNWRASSIKDWLIRLIPLAALGGWITGALNPTNTWDFYTYGILAACVLAYTGWRNSPRAMGIWPRLALTATVIVTFFLVARVAYQPYFAYYAQGYTKLRVWDGARSYITDFLVHWGYFLFILISWLGWQTYRWMEATPLEPLLRKKERMLGIVTLSVVILVAGLIMTLMGIRIALIVVPLGLWTALLLLIKQQSDAQRLILFMAGTALALMLVVEVVVIVGDIGRMNTVFKLYLQAWVLLGLSVAIMLGDLLLRAGQKAMRGAREGWLAVLMLLTAGVALFPIMATTDKVTDRIAENAPHTLDGMAYMPYATVHEGSTAMSIAEDYAAITWMQDHVAGSPVIVEANVPEYRWGSRYSIYTGLPAVVGWNWHQRQQRGVVSTLSVTDRVDQVTNFYLTPQVEEALSFIHRYDVSYIIVGQLERAVYPPEGLAKFEANQGLYWDAVVAQGNTVIYKVRE